ncbi:hypothetical protein LINGRAHAP2_LOCUS26412 [Linum grandiflorum]
MNSGFRRKTGTKTSIRRVERPPLATKSSRIS